MTSMRLLSTPSQTVGPFLSIAMRWERAEYVVPDGSAGAFWVRGRLLDGDGEPVPDGLIETWQADPQGGFAHADRPRRAGSDTEDFGGFGRSLTDSEGAYAVHTVKPGRVGDGADGLQAPHLDVSVFARGLLHRVVTRIYFADEAQANATDPVLALLPDDEARSTLIAQPDDEGGYVLDVHLQGAAETVFFAL